MSTGRLLSALVVMLAFMTLLASCGGGQQGDPFALCGNGVLDPGEQCDDGNLTDGDGCRSNCTFELIPGNGSGSRLGDNRACLMEWAVFNPNNAPALDKRGRRNYTQTCRNNDASCDLDLDTSDHTCEFKVVACLNNLDPNLPGCSQLGVSDGMRVVLPNPTHDPDNYGSLVVALQNLRNPATGATRALPVSAPQTNFCTTPFSIRVKLRGSTRLSAGRVTLHTISRSFENSPRSVTDFDSLTLVCTP